MSTSLPTPGVAADPELVKQARIAIIASRWNEEIIERLLGGATARLSELGVLAENVELHRVPGAYELPTAALWAAGEKRISAVIAIGCVVRGDTPHFDYVAGNCAQGLMQASLSSGKPVIFGVLTVNTHEQALERCGGLAGSGHGHAGTAAADAAIEMLGAKARIRDNPGVVQQNFMGIRMR